jgi:hypothetical protein
MAFYLAYQILKIIYSLLSRIKFVSKIASTISKILTKYKQVSTNWLQKSIPSVIRLCELIFEVFGDIIVFGILLAFMVERIHDIQIISASNSSSSWYGVSVDMWQNWIYWLALFLFLLLWLIGKSRKYLIEKDNARRNNLFIEYISKKLEEHTAINNGIVSVMNNMTENMKEQAIILKKISDTLDKLSNRKKGG